MENNIEDQIEEAAKKFKEAIEACGKQNVVVAYTYTTPKDKDFNSDTIMCGYQAQSFIHALGSVEFIKDMLLSGQLS